MYTNVELDAKWTTASSNAHQNARRCLTKLISQMKIAVSITRHLPWQSTPKYETSAKSKAESRDGKTDSA